MEDDKEKAEIKKNANNDVEQKFKWILVCENIAEVKKCELDKIFEIPIIEFLNFISYVNWKNKYMEKKYKKNGI